MKRNGARDSSQERITVRVTTKAHETSITPPDPEHGITWYQVRVPEIPEGGKANEAVVRAVASYLGVAPSRLHIRRGQGSRLKILEIV